MSNLPDNRPSVSVPDEQKFAALVRRAFASGRLTNNGALARELEARLAERLQVPHVVLTSSGTLALQIAYRALGLTGEVITTPFSWVTTASSLCWVGLQPVFADIDAASFNLDPNRIEACITPRTSAILAVHTFGNPGDLVAIEAIAARHGLRVIYDAAQAFGLQYRGRSVFALGDASVLSLHATKLFHTVEGGAVILRDAEAARCARLAVNNGMSTPERVEALGINGRMSELHAAVGLCLLDEVQSVIERRNRVAGSLRAALARSSAVRLQQLNAEAQVNHTNFPVVFPTPAQRERAVSALNARGFPARRYFTPSLNRLPFVGAQPPMPRAEDLSECVVCLPLGPNTSTEQAEEISRIVAAVCPAVASAEPARVLA
jgi:dTDP-4-amino-4,6-dideoxygalactose transaminase